MKVDEVERLLAAYYEGATDEHEEKRLKEALLSQDLPEHLEPDGRLLAALEAENMGDVIGDLNKRRGQVEGMESSRSGARIVKAMVPLAEMFGYVTALRTITSGRATSSMVYSHHAQVSNSIAKAVLEEVKGRADLI